MNTILLHSKLKLSSTAEQMFLKELQEGIFLTSSTYMVLFLPEKVIKDFYQVSFTLTQFKPHHFVVRNSISSRKWAFIIVAQYYYFCLLHDAIACNLA